MESDQPPAEAGAAIASTGGGRSEKSMFLSGSWREMTNTRGLESTSLGLFGGGNPLESSFQSAADDDEEELLWAAFEKLPTVSRMRTSMFQKDMGGRFKHVDVKKLSSADLHGLLQKLIKAGNDEAASLPIKIRKRLDRVGIDVPTIEIRYEHLHIEADTHVGNRNLPTLWNSALNIFETILDVVHLSPSRKRVLTILDDVSGIIKPGRMTLLLGPPSSGKTTLLLALAGKVGRGLRVKGKVTFNGHTHDEFVPQKTSAYVSQNDLHVGQMTVRENLSFSAHVQGTGSQYQLLEETTRREKEAGVRPEADVDTYMKAAAMPSADSSVVVEYTLKMLGLDVCADTLLGDEMRRGVSGGQKKRVTTGEMIVGPTKTLFMDEISTGLDSSTTSSIMRSLSRFARGMGGTVMVSLLQPAPETYDLFDDIILLSEGQVVYHGPCTKVLEFMEFCGFRCPERKGVADFLQEVTSRKDQEQYWADKRQPYQYFPVKKFVEAYQSFHVGENMMQELAIPFPKKTSHKAALVTQRYSVSKWQLLKASFRREWLLMRRNRIIYIVKGTQITVAAFISMTTFFRTRLHQNVEDGNLYLGALFYTVIVLMFRGFGELTATIGRLPVLIKQRDLLFLPAWAYSLSAIVLSMPVSFVECGIFVCMTYYVTGYAPDASRFFKQYLLLFVLQQVTGAMFRTIGGLCRTITLAFTLGWIMLLLLLMLGGFLMPRPSIPKWWRWAFWLSPLSYAEQAINTNEFLAPRWQGASSGNLNQTVGVEILNGRGQFAHANWYWIGIGALLGFFVFFNVAFTLTLSYLPALGKPQAIMSEKELSEKEANKTGDLSLGRLSKQRSKSRSRAVLSSRSLGGDQVQMQQSKSRRASLHQQDGDGGVEAKEAKEERGMMLPFLPLSISFDDVSYYVDMPAELKSAEVTETRLKLLSNITGAFQPGVLTALMGVSGAGKTTLMDVLAGRKTGGYIEGDIYISGYPKVQKTFARISGYCEQNDIHSPQVTVRESLIYSAWLRLAPEIDDATKMAFVDEVLDLVELNPLQDALVGVPGITGLSTEQRKRLTIAVELVANPSIIFMDEPTSGLDARAAAIVMRTVRNTVDTGRTVVCTIHQPSIDIFEAFDELLLLKRGGQVIYAGELGRKSVKLVEYFEALPGTQKIKEGYNPATWMLDVSNVEMESQLGVDYAELYSKSSLYQRNKELVKALSAPNPGSKDISFPTEYSQKFFSQLRCILWKQNLTYWRSPDYNLVRGIFSFFTAVIVGSIFWQVGRKTSSSGDLSISMGALYAATLFICFNNSGTVQSIVSVERTVHYREKAAGLYSSIPYALAGVLIEVPYVFVQAVMYCIIVYSMIGFYWTPAKFFWFFYTVYISLLTFTYYGMMLVAITPNFVLASICMAFFTTLFNLYAGFLIPRPRIPGWWIWFYWLCPLAWTMYTLMASQYGDLTSNLTVVGQPTANYTVKSFLVHEYGFHHGFLAATGPMLVVWMLVFAGIFIYAIKFLNFQRR